MERDNTRPWSEIAQSEAQIEALIHEAIGWVVHKHYKQIEEYRAFGYEPEDFYNEAFLYCWKLRDRIDPIATRKRVFNFFVSCAENRMRDFNKKLRTVRKRGIRFVNFI